MRARARRMRAVENCAAKVHRHNPAHATYSGNIAPISLPWQVQTCAKPFFAGLRRSIRIAALPSSSPPLVYDGGRRPLQLLIGQATVTRCTWAPGTSRAAHQGRGDRGPGLQLFRRDAERAVRLGAPGRGGNLRAAPLWYESGTGLLPLKSN
jgi:hypothetical protein